MARSGLVLQSPVVRRAGLAMRLFHIHLCDAGIMLHHIQAAMPQWRLNGENIAARTQIGDGKGMPETMGMAFLHTDLFTQRFDQLVQSIMIKGPVKFS